MMTGAAAASHCSFPIRRIARLVLIVLTASPAFAGEISGAPRIVDGDTVEIGQVKIRLSGINAPESDQICLDAKGQRWACGIAARDQLIQYSNGQIWECTTTGTDQYGRSLANCFIEGEDVSKWMVRSGWALSFVRYSHAYDADEMAAREARAGLWSGIVHRAVGLATSHQNDDHPRCGLGAGGRSEDTFRWSFVIGSAIPRVRDQG